MENYAGNVQTQPMQSMNTTGTYNQLGSSINNLQDTYGGVGAGVMPQAQQTASNLYNNPYAAQGQAGANQAAGMGAAAAGAGFNTGANLAGAGQSLVPYAQNIMQTGMDPQQALYSRTLQQVQDQSNVNNSMAGVATSPYGAGLTNQATSNFNIDWQNNQLQRQATAAGAAGGLEQAGANVAGQGVSMMNQAPSQMVQSAMIPYSTYSDIGQGQNQALTQLLGIGQSGANLSNTSIQDLLGMLSGGNQSNQVANQTSQVGLNQANLGWNQMKQLGSGIGNLAGMFL